MLPASRRIRRADEFRSVMGSGTRSATRTLVVHVGSLPPGPGRGAPAGRHGDSDVPAFPARAGFIVGRSVHRSAVVRNRVARRLRHLTAQHLDAVPPGFGVVVRALPAAASAPSSALEPDLARALGACLRRLGHQAVPTSAVSQ